MSAVAVLRPANPRGNSHLVLLIGHGWLLVVEFGYDAAQVFLDALAHEFLLAVELVAYIVEGATVLVVAVHGNGENLIVALDFEVQFLLHETLDGSEYLMQVLLVVGEEWYIVGILGSVHRLRAAYLDVQPLIYPVHEVGEAQVGEVLRQVVAYRQSRSRVYNLVQQPQEVCVLNLPAHDAFQHLVVDAWVELANVNL